MGQSNPSPSTVPVAAQPTKSLAKPQAGMQMGTGVPAFTAMMADPLGATPVGKPDFNSVATVAHRFRDVYNVSTTASGEYYGLFTSGPYLGDYPAATITAGAVTGLGTQVGSGMQTALTNDYVSIRTLCFVVEWLPTLSDLNAAGRIFLGQYNTSNAVGAPQQAIDAYFDDEGQMYSAKQWACSIGRPTGDLPFHIMGANDFPGIFPQIAVAISGMPAVAQKVGQIIVTRIVEAVPLGTTLSKGRAEHSICDMMDCCCAANLIGERVRQAGGGDKWSDIVSKAMKVAKLAVRLGTAYSTSGASELARLVAQAA